MPLRHRVVDFLLLSLSALAGWQGLPAHAAPAPDVLVLFSNDRLLPANIEVDQGFRSTLAKSPAAETEVFAEFLDTPTFSGERYEQAVATYLNEKYGSRMPSVIVVAGRPALEFMLRHRAALFPDVPVVHLAIDQEVLRAMTPLPADIVGVPVVYDFEGTIRQALQWHPSATRLVVVTGASASDRTYEASARAAVARIQGLPPVEFLAGLSTAEVKEHLSRLASSDVVFTPGYFRDGAGQLFAPREAAALMAAAAPAPVYGAFSTFIGSGIVGGRMPSYVEMGREAALAVERLVEGTPPAQLRMPALVPAQVQVDWRQVRRWGIGAEKVPVDAIVHFKEPTLWEAYRVQALSALAVLLLQAALIAALLVERRQRRRTASALAQSEQRMKVAARAARLTNWAWNVARWTPGPSKEQAGVLARVLESVHPADRDAVAHAVRLAVENGKELDVEYRIRHSDGNLRWMAARGRVNVDTEGGGKQLTGVSIDITARKNAELQAERDRAALTHMTRVSTMGQFSASIAHQLNQPLAAILGNAEAARMMLSREHPDPTELRAICDDIVSEDKRAAEIIRRLGALFKRGEMTFASLDLNELVLETLELVRTELANRQVTARTLLKSGLPPIQGDRVQLQQVLLNLILNASDAMAGMEGPSRLLLLHTAGSGDQVHLTVIDHGPGIADEQLPHVFDAFWSTKVDGTGVGLAICKSIATAHNAMIAAQNNPEGGATFRVSFPVQPRT
ncbi:ATP-binding protein [Variovorax robiniae]|uniref:histidine kinase n=1 Tax=Variovorax robiniae TaxID=1836199 RepID=A0ABU8XJ52_9BURK